MIFNLYASRIGPTDIKMLEKYSERLDTLLGVTMDGLIHLPYRQLKSEIPSLIASGKLEEAILMVLRSKAPKVRALSLAFVGNVKKLKFVFWIQDQYKLINKLEQQYLSAPPDMKLVAAGIRDLDVLGDKNIIDTLAQGNVLKWGAIQDLPYSTVFDKQLMLAITARISKNKSEQT